jgi:hypothetical protein
MSTHKALAESSLQLGTGSPLVPDLRTRLSTSVLYALAMAKMGPHDQLNRMATWNQGAAHVSCDLWISYASLYYVWTHFGAA